MYRSASTTDERKAATSLLLKEIDLCEDEFMIDPVAASYLREKVSPRNLCEFSKNDFDTYDVEPRLFFGGLAGNKIALSLPYFMFYTSFSNLVVKYPNDLRAKGVKNCSLERSNSPMSEFIGSHIYAMLGIPVHRTFLGKRNGSLVVACSYLPRKTERLVEFREIKTTFEPKGDYPAGLVDGKSTELSEVLKVLDEHPLFSNEGYHIEDSVKGRFWDMFVVDAFIGNPDRNNGNWGVLVDSTPTNPPRLAPVYDCGNCLGDKWDESKIEAYLSSGDFERASAATAMPSIFTRNGKKINPCAFISRHEHPDCDAAVRRIVPRIMAKLHGIDDLLASTPYMDDLHRRFYTSMMKERLSHSLLPAFNELEKEKTRHKALDRF